MYKMYIKINEILSEFLKSRLIKTIIFFLYYKPSYRFVLQNKNK